MSDFDIIIATPLFLLILGGIVVHFIARGKRR